MVLYPTIFVPAGCADGSQHRRVEQVDLAFKGKWDDFTPPGQALSAAPTTG